MSNSLTLPVIRAFIFYPWPSYILSTAAAYLCVIAVQHFLNDPHGEINTINLPVLVSFNTAVRGVIIVST